VVRFGTADQQRRMLPPLIAGREKACFAVTEPDVGLDTTHLRTKAVRAGDGYVVSGSKVWISTAQVAHKMLLLARTTPLEDCAKPTDGLSIFYTDLDRSRVGFARSEDGPQGRRLQPAVHRRAARAGSRPDRRGGRGFQALLHGLNPERILIAAEAIGLGRAALARRRRLRQGTRRVRPADRPEPGDPAPAGRQLDAARGGRSS